MREQIIMVSLWRALIINLNASIKKKGKILVITCETQTKKVRKKGTLELTKLDKLLFQRNLNKQLQRTNYFQNCSQLQTFLHTLTLLFTCSSVIAVIFKER